MIMPLIDRKTICMEYLEVIKIAVIIICSLHKICISDYRIS